VPSKKLILLSFEIRDIFKSILPQKFKNKAERKN